MIKGGEIPIMNVPTRPFGLLSMAKFENQNMSEAFAEALEQYSPEAIESLTYNFSFNPEGLAIGSSPIALAFLNQENLFPNGEHLLSISEFGQAHNKDSDFFKGTYQDTGIILRTAGDKYEGNDHMTKGLFGKLEKRGLVASPESPVVISITDLGLRRDRDSRYGLVWDLKEDASPIVAPEYGTKESVEKFSFYDERGIPIPNKEGKFNIWKRDTGLSRVYSVFGGDANLGYDHLAYSNGGGRVTVGGEEVPQSYMQVKEAIKQEEERRVSAKKDLEAMIAKL